MSIETMNPVRPDYPAELAVAPEGHPNGRDDLLARMNAQCQILFVTIAGWVNRQQLALNLPCIRKWRSSSRS